MTSLSSSKPGFPEQARAKHTTKDFFFGAGPRALDEALAAA
jgi:hypothetical protein